MVILMPGARRSRRQQSLMSVVLPFSGIFWRRQHLPGVRGALHGSHPAADPAHSERVLRCARQRPLLRLHTLALHQRLGMTFSC